MLTMSLTRLGAGGRGSPGAKHRREGSHQRKTTKAKLPDPKTYRGVSYFRLALIRTTFIKARPQDKTTQAMPSGKSRLMPVLDNEPSCLALPASVP